MVLIALFTVNFTHLHDSVFDLNLDVRPFQAKTAELPEFAVHIQIHCNANEKRQL